MVLSDYAIMLTRPPEEEVRVTATPTLPKESELKDPLHPGKGIALNGSESGVTLVFDRTNWFIPQVIHVTAPNDTFWPKARGSSRFCTALCRAPRPMTGGAYDGLAIPSVSVEVVDDDKPGVVVATTDGQTFVSEKGQFGASDTYSMVLTQAPASRTSVTITLTADQQITLSTSTLTFTSADWNDPTKHTVTVHAFDDTLPEGIHYSRITQAITSTTDPKFNGVLVDSVDVTIADDEVPSVLIMPAPGGVNVIEPTDLVKLGDGQVIPGTVTDPNTQFLGDFGFSILKETTFHNTPGSAQNIDLGKWSTNFNPEVSASTAPAPHLTIVGTGDSTKDYYSFTGTSGSKVTLDIDHGYDFGDSTSWFSKLTRLGHRPRRPGHHPRCRDRSRLF